MLTYKLTHLIGLLGLGSRRDHPKSEPSSDLSTCSFTLCIVLPVSYTQLHVVFNARWRSFHCVRTMSALTCCSGARYMNVKMPVFGTGPDSFSRITRDRAGLFRWQLWQNVWFGLANPYIGEYYNASYIHCTVKSLPGWVTRPLQAHHLYRYTLAQGQCYTPFRCISFDPSPQVRSPNQRLYPNKLFIVRF